MTLTLNTVSGPLPVLPCPPWCSLPPDHHLGLWLRLLPQPLAEEDAGWISRTHIAKAWTIDTQLAPVSLEVGQLEEIHDPLQDEPPPPCITLGEEELSAEQSRTLAAALLEAADVLDRIS